MRRLLMVTSAHPIQERGVNHRGKRSTDLRRGGRAPGRRVQVQCGGCGQVVAGRPSADARAPLRHGWSTGTARRGGRGRGTEAVTARRRDGNGVYTVHAADAAVVVSAVAGTHGDQKHWSSGSGIMNTETARSSRVPGLHVPWRSRPPAAQPVTSKKKNSMSRIKSGLRTLPMILHSRHIMQVQTVLEIIIPSGEECVTEYRMLFDPSKYTGIG